MRQLGETKIIKRVVFLIYLTLGLFMISPIFSFADEASSNSFSILESVIASGDYSTSLTYILRDDFDEFMIGTSTASSFGLNDGFLFYPFVSTPVLSATAGNGQVSLFWTASQGFLGWNVSGYEVGISTVSGGNYSFTDVGNVLTSTKNLTNGTTYYFVVRAKDAFGNPIITSLEVFATPSSLGGEGGIFGGLIPPFGFSLGLGVIGRIPPLQPPRCSRSDFNCDGRINLQDFSILLTNPEKSDRSILSYLFSDWTEVLPIPFVSASEFALNRKSQQRFSENKEVAQVINVFPPAKTIPGTLWSSLKNIFSPLLQWLRELIKKIFIK